VLLCVSLFFCFLFGVWGLLGVGFFFFGWWGVVCVFRGVVCLWLVVVGGVLGGVGGFV